MITFDEKLRILLKYPEMLDVMEIIISGAKKHDDENWLKVNGNTMSRNVNSDSMFHHLCDFRSGKNKDVDSGFPPELHIACRALMAYTRRCRNLIHKDDALISIQKITLEAHEVGYYDENTTLSSQNAQTVSEQLPKILQEIKNTCVDYTHINNTSWACDNGHCRCKIENQLKKSKSIMTQDHKILSKLNNNENDVEKGEC